MQMKDVYMQHIYELSCSGVRSFADWSTFTDVSKKRIAWTLRAE
jgi:hypothetical protein